MPENIQHIPLTPAKATPPDSYFKLQVKAWTRSKFDAAKKRWAQNEVKFTHCQKKPGEKQEVKRLSLHDRGHFLEGHVPEALIGFICWACWWGVI